MLCIWTQTAMIQNLMKVFVTSGDSFQQSFWESVYMLWNVDTEQHTQPGHIKRQRAPVSRFYRRRNVKLFYSDKN